jgi:hypothetical protein
MKCCTMLCVLLHVVPLSAVMYCILPVQVCNWLCCMLSCGSCVTCVPSAVRLHCNGLSRLSCASLGNVHGLACESSLPCCGLVRVLPCVGINSFLSSMQWNTVVAQLAMVLAGTARQIRLLPLSGKHTTLTMRFAAH